MTSTAWCCAPAWPPTKSWCCAPTPGIASRSASRCRRRRSKRRWRRSRTSRACWSKLFHPAPASDRTRRRAAAAQVNAVEQALDRVSNLNEDRVLRQLLALIQATLRTNRWRTGSAIPARRAHGAASWASSSIRPGCRACPARGHWSRSSSTRRASRASTCAVARWRAAGCAGATGRRTSAPRVLGLVKAQDGEEHRHRAGGQQGRLRAQAPATGQRARGYLKEGVACYQDYLRALLDLTDNLVAGQVKPPPLVRRLDGDDPTWWSRPTRHCHLLRPCQRHRGRVRPLAGRRLRLRRQRRLRPQGHGHHCARRLGKCQAPLPRAGLDTQSQEFSVVGCRRHVRRRVRQRHAAVAAHPADRRL